LNPEYKFKDIMPGLSVCLPVCIIAKNLQEKVN
jgi:hypothetical protein